MTRTVVITGVSGGIGAATAQLFKNTGWYTIGLDLAKPIDNFDCIDCFIQADISQDGAWQDIASKIAMTVDRVNAVVHNAAIQVCKPLVETTCEEWDKVMAVNLRSVYLGTKHLFPLMSEGGAIVNVSSVHAIATSTKIAAYAASKGGMLALTRALALELAPKIRVNAVLPGAVDTDMLRSGLMRGHVTGSNSDELVAALGNKHVVARVGQPREIAEAIYFLADGDKSSFMTGQSLVVDGAATARLSTE